MQALFDALVDVDAVDEFGDTALHEACRQNHAVTVDLLVNPLNLTGFLRLSRVHNKVLTALQLHCALLVVSKHWVASGCTNGPLRLRWLVGAAVGHYNRHCVCF